MSNDLSPSEQMPIEPSSAPPSELEQFVDQLSKEGQQELDRLKQKANREQAFFLPLWLTAVKDLLEPRLAGSNLYAKFGEIYKKSDNNTNKDDSDPQTKSIIEETLFVLAHVKPLLRQTLNSSVPGSKPAKTIPDRLDEAFERDLQARLTENYINSWLSKVQGGILALMLIFAIAGSFQIASFSIDLHKAADEAVEKAKQEIRDRIDTIQKGLQSQAASASQSITDSRATHVSILQSQAISASQSIADSRAANLSALQSQAASASQQISDLINAKETEVAVDLSDLVSQVNTLDIRLNNLDNRLQPIATVYAAINPHKDDPWLEKAADVVLNTGIVDVLMGIVLAFFALLVAAFYILEGERPTLFIIFSEILIASILLITGLFMNSFQDLAKNSIVSLFTVLEGLMLMTLGGHLIIAKRSGKIFTLRRIVPIAIPIIAFIGLLFIHISALFGVQYNFDFSWTPIPLVSLASLVSILCILTLLAPFLFTEQR